MKNLLYPLMASTLMAVPLSQAHAEAHRSHIFGAGIFLEHWLTRDQLPARFRDNPRAYNQAQLDLLVEMGATACHGTFDWCDIEPVRGRYTWTKADERVEDAVSRGLAIYGYIGHTPDWAVPAGGPPGYRTPPDEKYLSEFQAYCTAVAERYRGKVDHFFFWNEPNGCSWVNDGCSNGDQYPLYTKWLKIAYAALKAGNPDCVVGAGVLDYNHGVKDGWKYIEGIYNEGGKDFFDAIVIHPYAPDGMHWKAIHDTRNVMVSNGDSHKPIWINEYGWSNSRIPEAPGYLRDFLERIRQPEYDYVTYCRYLVVSDLPGEQYGLCDRELNRRPIFFAFKEFDKTPPEPPTPSPTPLMDEIVNPGFENGLTGWISWQEYPYGPKNEAGKVEHPGRMPLKLDVETNHPPSGHARTGKHSAGSDVGWASARGGMYQEIRVQPGHRYLVIVYGFTGPDDESLRLGWIDGVEKWEPDRGIPGEPIELARIFEGVSDWTSLRGQFVPTKDRITLYLDWRHEAATGIGSVFVDDWRLVNMGPTPP